MSGNHNKHQKQSYQCPSCGGFCKRSGCEREKAPPALPEPVIVDGRMLFTKAQMKAYGKACYEAANYYEPAKPTPADDKAVDNLMNLFGMKK